jgi:chaperone required for assembly of F1-ATPase
MPLTTLACTAVDQVYFAKEEVIDNCLRYFPTDSALFFTEEGDRILHTKQRKHLQPVIRWLNRQLNLSLEATTNMSRKIDHSPETIETIRRILESSNHAMGSHGAEPSAPPPSTRLGFPSVSYTNMKRSRLLIAYQ